MNTNKNKNIFFVFSLIIVGFMGANIVFEIITSPSRPSPSTVHSQERLSAPDTLSSALPLQREAESPEPLLHIGSISAIEETQDDKVEELDYVEMVKPKAQAKKPVYGPTALPDITLNGIYSDNSGEKIVLINGQIFREGAIVRGIKIVQILSDRVDMEKEGDRFTIKMH